MHRHFNIIIIVLSWLFIPAAYTAELSAFTENSKTPPLELGDIHGQRHSLADYRGKVVLVNFWASWCHPCLQEIPELIRLDEILAGRPFAILAVNVGESPQNLPGFAKKMDEHMVMLLDPESGEFKRWQGIGLPSTFVLDGTGRIRYEAYGPVNWDASDVVDTLLELMEK